MSTFKIKVLHGKWLPLEKGGETLVVEGLTRKSTIEELKQQIIKLNAETNWAKLVEQPFWFKDASSLMYAGRVLDHGKLEDYGIFEEVNVAYAHWYSFNVPLSKYKLELFTKTFEKYDLDRSGEIDALELHALVNELGMSRTRYQCEEMVDEIDADGSGEIDFKEFCMLLVKIMNEDSNNVVLEKLEALKTNSSEEERRQRDSGALIMWEAPTSTN
jgi:hypothetical protein